MAEDLSQEEYENVQHVRAGTAAETDYMTVIIALVEQAGLADEGGEVTLPPGWQEAAAGKAIAVHEPGDGSRTLKVVNTPPTREVQAILEASGGWLEAKTGKALKVTGASLDGERVMVVREDAPGRWSEPADYHPDCFLREAVLASGVPLL